MSQQQPPNKHKHVYKQSPVGEEIRNSAHSGGNFSKQFKEEEVETVSGETGRHLLVRVADCLALKWVFL